MSLGLLCGAIFAVRPLIDLTGEYRGGPINLGGLAGLVVAAALATASMASRYRVPRQWTAGCLLLLAYLALHGVVSGTAAAPAEQGPGMVGPAATWARSLAGLAPLIALPVLLAMVRTHPRYLRNITIVLTAATAVPVLLELGQVAGFIPYSYFDVVNGAWVGRPSGGYHHPNSLGRLLVFVAFFWSVLCLAGMTRRWAIHVAWGVALPCIALTTHRTSLLSGLLVSGLVYWCWLRTGQQGPKRALRAILLMGACTGAALLILQFLPGKATPSWSRDQIQNGTLITVLTRDWGSFSNPRSDQFLRGRGVRWQVALAARRDADLPERLFGRGYEPVEAHNDLIRTLLVAGWIGAAALWLGLAALVRSAAGAIQLRAQVLLQAAVGYLLLFGITLHPTAAPFFMWLWTFSLLLLATLFPARGMAAQGDNSWGAAAPVLRPG